MKWFKHYTKAHEDRAVEKLIIEFGVKGYGLYFYCVEIIAGNLDSENISFELEPDAEILARRLAMDTLEVEKIMHRCIELRLFEIADSGRISCQKLGKFIDKSQSKNPDMIKIIEKYRNSSEIRELPGTSEIFRELPGASTPEEKRREEKRKDINTMSDLENDEPDIFPKPETPAEAEDPNKTELIKTVIDYLNEKAGTKYRYDSYKTLHHLSARIKDGYTLNDFKSVIDKKCQDWIGTKWEDYLRPETLFNETKFESYLNQRIRGSPKTSTPRKSIEDREREVREKYGNATR